MSQLTSMVLLSGGMKDIVGSELAKPGSGEEVVAAPPAGADDFDIDSMTSEQLSGLLKDNAVLMPPAWSSWPLDQQKAWIKEQFAAQPAEQTVGDNTTSPTPISTSDPDAADAYGGEQPKKKGKGKAKSTAVAKTDVKSGEIVEADVLQDIVHEIENLKQAQALSYIEKLTEETEVSFFRLGGVLSVIQANNWIEPFASFKEFVEHRFGLHYRKATYYIEIYTRLASSGIPWSKVKTVGWTKLKEIARVITIENVDEWVQIASEQNTITLIETVKNALAKNSPQALEDQTVKAVTTITFKAHDGQKEVIKAAIGKAKQQSGTTVDTVALEAICSEFLSGMTLAQRCKATTPEKWFEAFEQVYPDWGVDITPPGGSDEKAA